MDGGPPSFPRDSSCPAVLWIRSLSLPFRLRGSHSFSPAFPCRSTTSAYSLSVLTPKILLLWVWPLSLSLATTRKISFDFSSSPYLDVSVQAVPLVKLFIHFTIRALLTRGFPHSDICGFIAYLQLPAAFRSLSRPSSAPDAKAFPLRSLQLDLSLLFSLV